GGVSSTGVVGVGSGRLGGVLGAATAAAATAAPAAAATFGGVVAVLGVRTVGRTGPCRFRCLGGGVGAGGVRLGGARLRGVGLLGRGGPAAPGRLLRAGRRLGGCRIHRGLCSGCRVVRGRLLTLGRLLT